MEAKPTRRRLTIKIEPKTVRPTTTTWMGRMVRDAPWISLQAQARKQPKKRTPIATARRTRSHSSRSSCSSSSPWSPCPILRRQPGANGRPLPGFLLLRYLGPRAGLPRGATFFSNRRTQRPSRAWASQTLDHPEAHVRPFGEQCQPTTVGNGPDHHSVPELSVTWRRQPSRQLDPGFGRLSWASLRVTLTVTALSVHTTTGG